MMGGGKEDDWSNVTRKAKSVIGVLNFGQMLVSGFKNVTGVANFGPREPTV